MGYRYSSRLSNSVYFGTRPHMLSRARSLRREMTRAEELLWKQIRRKQIAGVRFRRQHPVGRFIADFYCHEARLIIEVDGGYHLDRDQAEYDKGRTHELSEMGIMVIRFTNEEVESNIKSVMDSIKKTLAERLNASGL